MSMLDGNNELDLPNGMLSADFPFTEGNAFQNLSVSSPAPVTIFYPSGLIERYKTL